MPDLKHGIITFWKLIYFDIIYYNVATFRCNIFQNSRGTFGRFASYSNFTTTRCLSSSNYWSTGHNSRLVADVDIQIVSVAWNTPPIMSTLPTVMMEKWFSKFREQRPSVSGNACKIQTRPRVERDRFAIPL